MLPNARRSDLLYVSYFYGNEVFAYDYPGGKLLGTLTGIPEAQGMCTAKRLKGKWWVVATGSNQVFEFAHGGTSPLATLDVTAGAPASCAVDPATGNLAVTMITNDNVIVYKNGSGSAVTYTAPFGPYFSAYDKSGDLYVDGSGQTPLAELPKGGSSFEPIATNQTIIFPGRSSVARERSCRRRPRYFDDLPVQHHRKRGDAHDHDVALRRGLRRFLDPKEPRDRFGRRECRDLEVSRRRFAAKDVPGQLLWLR